MVFRVRLSRAAEADIVEILASSELQFGAGARVRYEQLLIAALSDLATDPDRPDVLLRPDLGADIRSYHLRFSRLTGRSEDGLVRRPRHMFLFRLLSTDLLGIGRVLFDGMDVQRHLPSDFGTD